MASEGRMQSATSTSRLQHTAKLGVFCEMLQLTEATTGGMRRAARGCWSHYYGKRRAHAVRDNNETTVTYRKARRVRRDATTDRGHHCGMRRAARGCWSYYYGKRRAHKNSNKIPQNSPVRQDATTDRGHHWGHAKSSKRLRLLEYFTKNTSELEEKSVSGEFFYLEFIQ